MAVCAFAVLAAAADARAELKGRNELSLQAGAMVYEGDSNLDTGFIYGGRLGHFFTENVSGEMAFFPGSTKNHGTDISTLYPSAAVLYHFRHGKLLPFLDLGAGMMRYKADGINAQNDFALHCGGGLKWLLARDWALRADLAYVLDVDSYIDHNYGAGPNNLLAAAGISWFFGSGEKQTAAAPAAPTDSDKDGVPDEKDACPSTPAGVSVSANGCPLDADADGIPDYQDACSSTPAGVAVTANGCPADTDKDGIPDYQDECPATPAATSVDPKGCPIGTKAMPTDQWILRGVTFEVNSDVLTSGGMTILDEAVTILKPRASVRLEIQGHTDNTGDAKHNMALSQKRAEAVKRYLVDKGIAPERLETKGYGDSMPVGDNSTEQGRESNRRIEFKVLSK